MERYLGPVMEMTMHANPVLTALDHFDELKRNLKRVMETHEAGEFSHSALRDIMEPLELMAANVRRELDVCKSDPSLAATQRDALNSMIEGLGSVEEVCRLIRADITDYMAQTTTH